jgi:hypothetical protein
LIANLGFSAIFVLGFEKIYSGGVMMKAFFLAVLMLLVTVGFWGCEVVIGPPHGRVVVAPGPPPPVVVIPARPRLVFIPEYSIYVAPDVSYDIFYDGTVWFYFSNERWYRGREYNGPWVFVEKGLPPGLTKLPPGQLKKRAFKVKNNDDSSDDGKSRDHRRKGNGRHFRD